MGSDVCGVLKSSRPSTIFANIATRRPPRIKTTICGGNGAWRNPLSVRMVSLMTYHIALELMSPYEAVSSSHTKHL